LAAAARGILGAAAALHIDYGIISNLGIHEMIGAAEYV